MKDKLAILAGNGALPLMLADAYPDAIFTTYTPVEVLPTENRHIAARFERFGELFTNLHDAGVTRIVMAGATTRPVLDKSAFDAETTVIFPRFLAAMAQGDDALLSELIAIFEEQGFVVLGAHDLLPELTAEHGQICGPKPDAQALSDASKARGVLQALSGHDIGQAAVFAGGLCLGIETLQGTDALLKFVAQTPDKLRRAKGVLVKCPKPGQELRVDMPAIGPATIKGAVAAGLGGIVIDAGKVMILERDRTLAALEKAGLFLLAE